MDNKELAISETLRLIKINHNIQYSDVDAINRTIKII